MSLFYHFDYFVTFTILSVPPNPPFDIITTVFEKNGLYNINITWTLGSIGNSPIIQNHLAYAVEKVDTDWLIKTVPVNKRWFVIGNISFNDVVYFKMASENAVGIGPYTEAVKFIISPSMTAKNI